MTPKMNFLVNDVLPKDWAEVKRIRRQAGYTIIDDELFKRGFSSPLLKCLDRAQA